MSMDLLLTFLEGVVSFLSPCTLPLLPVFVAYFAGNSGERVPVAGTYSRTVLRALAFVLGFSAVFISLGVFAASVGEFFAEHRTAVSVISGLVVIVFGLGFLNIIRLPLKGLGARSSSAFLFGVLFALNLTPCIGAFLAAALATAAHAGTAAKGAALLAAYSAGLGVPFLLAAMALARLNGLFVRIKASYDVFVPICGVLLLLYGGWMVVSPFFGGDSAAESPAPAAAETAAVADAPAEPAKVYSEPVEIRSAEMFEAEVLKADRPVIVDFWAPWCGPCRRMGPVLAEIARDRGAELKVCKVNVDELRPLAKRYRIRSLPSIFLFRGGEAGPKSIGLVPRARLLKALELPADR